MLFKIKKSLGISIAIFVLIFIMTRQFKSMNVENRLELEPDERDYESISIMVLTSEKSLSTRGLAVWNTWGRQFKNIVFTCNCPNVLAFRSRNQTTALPMDFKKLNDIPILYLNVTEDKERMGEKVLVVLKETYKLFFNKSKWYYMVDDDAYVFGHNLVKFLKNKNTSVAKIYGFKFKHLPLPGGHVGGGPGILITNESMKRLVEKINKNECDEFIDTYGDATIGGCANAAGIEIGYSNDVKGRPLFHFLAPNTHFYGPIPRHLYIFGVHDGKIGKECCSLETIAFHYVGENTMYEIHKNKFFLKDLLA